VYKWDEDYKEDGRELYKCQGLNVNLNVRFLASKMKPIPSCIVYNPAEFASVNMYTRMRTRTHICTTSYSMK